MPNLHFPRRLAFPRNPSFMFLLCSVAACLFAIMMTRPVASFQQLVLRRAPRKSRALYMADGAPEPTTFREAEVLGLKLMQEGDYDLALKGMCVCVFVWFFGMFRVGVPPCDVNTSYEFSMCLYSTCRLAQHEFRLISFSLSAPSLHSLSNWPQITRKPIRCGPNKVPVGSLPRWRCHGWIRE